MIMKQIPQIREVNGIQTLYVDDEPFFILGGEIHNSASSSLSYMEREVWPNLRDLNMNTVVAPLYWEQIEAEEGNYDFEVMDGLIRQARENGMHLVFLWFGLWKNAESMYVPGWMKKNTEVYFRAEKPDGEKLNAISPLCEAAVEKDAAAFAAIMKHIRETDGEESTVIMMQVENEIGLMGKDRDYSAQGQKAFGERIPAELAEYFEKNGTWTEVFGEDAGEAFMAYYFASAVEKITAAGRKEYPLPCYANAWLKQYPWYPGSYPSGGPVKEMHKIWKKTAPSLFTLAPDIYVPYVAEILDRYGYDGNPLFVPEVRKDAMTSSYCMYAFTAKNAIGYSPFGIEELALRPEAVDKPPMEVMIALNIDPSAFDITGSKEYLKKTYGLINQMKPLLLKYRGTDQMKSYVKKSETDFGIFLRFSNYDLLVGYSPKQSAKPLSAGTVIELEKNRFLLVGMNSQFTFMPKTGEPLTVDYLKIEEGTIENGEWKPGRVMNGDEKMSLRFGDMPSCMMVELYKY